MLVKLKEDLLMSDDNYGCHSGGGTAKAGTIFKVLKTPSPKKKMYKLEPQDVKFPYHLYLRENDFKRLFIAI